MKTTPKCSDCKHRTEYEAVKTRDQRIFICSGEGWLDEGDGSYGLIEISQSDAKDCILFCAV